MLTKWFVRTPLWCAVATRLQSVTIMMNLSSFCGNYLAEVDGIRQSAKPGEVIHYAAGTQRIPRSLGDGKTSIALITALPSDCR